LTKLRLADLDLHFMWLIGPPITNHLLDEVKLF